MQEYDETPKEKLNRWLNYYLEKILAALGSRKLWAAIVASVVILTNPEIPSEFKAYSVAGVWMSFVLGTAIEDFAERRNG